MVIPLRRRAIFIIQRQDFYTLCPGCETKVKLTLAAKLQAARSGCSCVCKSCKHEWVCIQEWIYRIEPIDHSRPVIAPNEHSPVPTQSSQPQTGDFLQSPTTVTAAPRVGTCQHSSHRNPSLHRLINRWHHLPAIPPEPAEQPIAQPVPAPHAWSWERKTEQQSTPPQNHQSGFGR
jgi:hypothetical protein